MLPVRCVVFDIDDTLYLERDYVRSGFAAVGSFATETLGVEDFAARAWAEFEAGRRGDIFDRVLGSTGRSFDRRTIAEMVAIYRRHAPRISLLADSRACLDQLFGRVALGCVTDGPLESQRAKAEALQLSRWLEPIVFTAALGAGNAKPSPTGFRAVEAASGAFGRACAYVADDPAKDFGGPAALGWRTVRLVRRGGLHSTAPSGGDVEAELPDLTSLPRALGFVT